MSVSFRPMGEAPDPPPPEKTLTAERVEDLADRLMEALATIENWGIQVDAIGRLREGERLLREVAAANAFPQSHEDLVEVAHAARDAQEFAEIGWMLPAEPIHPVAIALKDATADETSKPMSHLRPYQAQAELWVGAMLSCAADFVGSPLRHGRPDYIVRNGDMQYGIEVKRPQGADKIMRRASKASKQLRPWNPKYHGGALVMDLTDCLESGLATFHPGAPNLEDAQEWIGRRLRRLRRFIYGDSTGRIRSDHQHVFCLVVIARLVHWDLDDLSQIRLTRFIGCLVFPKSPKTLRGIRTAWLLAELIHRGMQAAGHHDLGGHEIVFENPGR